jgi:hypothetical protein
MSTGESDAAVLDALQMWTQGNHAGAVDRLRPLADSEEPVAVGLIAFFLGQMGEPHWRDGVPYAESALEKGMPWVANQYIGNMLNDPGLRQRVPDFLRAAFASGWQQLDPFAHAIAPYQQGDHNTALGLIHLAAGPFPWSGPWDEFLDRARGKLQELETASGNVEEREEAALKTIGEARERVETQAGMLQSRTEHLNELLEQITNAEVQTYFDREATQYEIEARTLWKWGVRVLVAAAIFAALPIVVYYIGQLLGTDWFDDQNLVAAHFAPAIAAGAVSGVLLARARGRDRARQRARDLSVALGTMFVYSEQISEESERQGFLREMGRTVIEAFLRQDAAGSDGTDNRSLLSELTRRQ